jgi:hypothetical protein
LPHLDVARLESVCQLLELVVAQLVLDREPLELLSVDEAALDGLREQRLDVRQFKKSVQGMLLRSVVPLFEAVIRFPYVAGALRGTSNRRAHPDT